MKYYIRILRRELIYPNPQNNITVFLMTIEHANYTMIIHQIGSLIVIFYHHIANSGQL